MMLRMTKLTDYGIVLLTHVARGDGRQVFNAADLAAQTGLPLPTVSKILKLLAKEGLLESRRGVKGGYGLGRPAAAISVAAIVRALEGPISITECSSELPEERNCDYQGRCPTRPHMQRINVAVQAALENIRLSELLHAPGRDVAPVVGEVKPSRTNGDSIVAAPPMAAGAAG